MSLEDGGERIPLRRLIADLEQGARRENRSLVPFLGRLARQFGPDIEIEQNLLDGLMTERIGRAEAFRLIAGGKSKRGSTHASGTDGRETEPREGICISPKRSTRKRERR